MIWKIKDGQIEYGNRVLIMGIVNVTPDSFSDGGDNFDVQNAVSTIFKMIDDGADIIDIGAQSTRPDHTPISSDEEWARLGPVLSAVKGKVGVPISIDTYYPQVAEKSLKTGANIINDVSGVISPKMAEIVKFHGSGWVLMHNGSGTVDEVKNFFINSVDICKSLGVNLSQICFDMGIGFGKNYEQNMELLANIDKYKPEGYPLLLGTSRKRVIGRGSEQDNPKERIFGNIAADTLGILCGVDIIRLHDVKREKQGVLMAENLRNFRCNG